MKDNSMKYSVLLSAVILIIINSFSCKSPSGPNDTLGLQITDVSCTEAWLNVTGQTGSEVILNRDGKEVKKITLTSSTQTIYDDSLLPNSTYTYQAIINNKTSSKITAKTLDTTSSDFTFQTFTFGGNNGSCTFYDCAIVNDTLAYAVGEVYLNDSTGQPDPVAYSIAIWNGQTWKLRKLYYRNKDYQGNYYTGSLSGITNITAFSPTNLWIASGSVFQWNGKDSLPELSFSRLMLIKNQDSGETINKLWGTSNSNLYGVGNKGTIVHYTNGSWQKIESGTDIDINDVWGVVDLASNQEKIYCAVSNVLEVSDHKILTISPGGRIDSVHWDTGRRVNSIWTNNPQVLYTSGGGVFNNKTGKWQEETSLPLYYTNRIRGNGLNDIFVAGDIGLLAHFNGVRWKVYKEFLQKPVTAFNSISVGPNMFVAVGFNGDASLIVVGTRN